MCWVLAKTFRKVGKGCNWRRLSLTLSRWRDWWQCGQSLHFNFINIMALVTNILSSTDTVLNVEKASFLKEILYEVNDRVQIVKIFERKIFFAKLYYLCLLSGNLQTSNTSIIRKCIQAKDELTSTTLISWDSQLRCLDFCSALTLIFILKTDHQLSFVLPPSYCLFFSSKIHHTRFSLWQSSPFRTILPP